MQVVTRNLFLFICPGCLSVSPAAGQGGTGTGGPHYVGQKAKRRVRRTGMSYVDGCPRSSRPLPTHLCLFGNRRRRNATDRQSNQSKSNFYTPPTNQMRNVFVRAFLQLRSDGERRGGRARAAGIATRKGARTAQRRRRRRSNAINSCRFAPRSSVPL